MILRLDYGTPIDDFAIKLPESVYDSLRDVTIRREVKEQSAEELLFNIDRTNIVRRIDKYNEWVFSNDFNRFIINKHVIIMSVSKYLSYNHHYSEFNKVWSAVLELYPQISLRRIGMRYINRIDLPDTSRPWNEFINPILVPQSIESKYPMQPIKQFNTIEYRTEDNIIRFQYGLPNPDYPSINMNKLFVLDYDEYTDMPVDGISLSDRLTGFHAHIQDLFEQSITEDLRSVMNDEGH